MVVKMQEALMSIGVKKGLPYTKFLNRELSKLRGSGVLQNILAIPKLTCPLDEELIPITFSKIIFLFSIFILGGTLSIIIFIIEQAFSKNRDATLEVNSSKKCNMIKGRIPKTNEIGVQCNIGQSVAIGTKNIMIH
jgi:hypothetical protein